LARTLYEAGKFDQARKLYEQLFAEQPGSVEALGQMGTLAARRKDAVEANRISGILAAMSDRHLRRSPDVWRARIAAQLGERARAVELLREAFAGGLHYGLWMHTDPDLASLDIAETP
jgi:predicted Zn-dependent protease